MEHCLGSVGPTKFPQSAYDPRNHPGHPLSEYDRCRNTTIPVSIIRYAVFRDLVRASWESGSGTNTDSQCVSASRGQLPQQLVQRYKSKSRRTVTNGVRNHKFIVVDHAAARIDNVRDVAHALLFYWHK